MKQVVLEFDDEEMELLEEQFKQIQDVAGMETIEDYIYYATMSHCKTMQAASKMFGKSHSQEVADRYQLPLLGQLPIDSELTQLSDQGYVENYHSDWFDEFSQKVKDI